MSSESLLPSKVFPDHVQRARENARMLEQPLRQAEIEYRLLKRRAVYAQLAHRLRVLGNRVEGKPILAFIGATASFGFLAFLLVVSGFGLKVVLLTAPVGFLVGAIVTAILLYYPTDTLLAERVSALPKALDQAAARLVEGRERLREASNRYEQLRRILESRRNRLLCTDWRSLAGIPFEQFLAQVAERLKGQGFKVQVQIVLGQHPASAILDTAQSVAVDLIALETHGRRGLSRLLLGSVADKVIRGASTPVLVHRSSDK
jgi:nucleotide-binding universal stress UspA family protein